MKIYTRTGDDGTTSLFGGLRVPKSDPRIEAYGTIDELNAALGVASAGADASIRAMLADVQHELFTLGSHLATPPESPAARKLPALSPDSVARLERQIDEAEARLAPLRQFILPAGNETSARLHLARTVCRRAERLLVALPAQHPVDPKVLTYINRLSDWLFVMARLSNRLGGIGDVEWRK